MINSEVITSAANPLIKYVRALNSSAQARKKEGVFVAEGVKLLFEAPIDRIEKVLASETYINEGGKVPNGAKVDIISDSLFNRICDTKTPQGVLTIIRRKQDSIDNLILSDNPFIVILDEVRDPGNVGTIIRTAEGAGVNAVIMSNGCADAFSPKTIRSAAGSLFRMPLIVSENLTSLIETLAKANIKVYAAHLNGIMDYDEPDYRKGTAIVIGNEANGIREEVYKKCDTLVRIPMEGKLESLNAAISAAILMYTVHRKRKAFPNFDFE